MKNYSIIPFLICLLIFTLTAVLSGIFIKDGNVWVVILIGAVGIAGVITVNEIAQKLRIND